MKDKLKKYRNKVNKIADLRRRLKYSEKTGFFEADDGDMKTVLYCLKQTEGLLNLIIEAEEETQNEIKEG